jgi:predicted GIY-YIG superfamily endonuclease
VTGSKKEDYNLKPRAFKKCLIRSKNENKYADYYLFLEEVVEECDYYKDKLLKNKYTQLRNNIIDKFNNINFTSKYLYIPELTKLILLNEYKSLLKSNNNSIIMIDNRIKHNYKVQCLYFIKESKQPNYKIGYTSNINNRIKELQTGNPRKLTIYKTILALRCEKLETYLHTYFSDNKIKNEWFKLKTSHIKNIISKITDGVLVY